MSDCHELQLPAALAGEVSERAELLNGSMQLALDGAGASGAPGWEVTLSLAWRLGRDGAVPLVEGDVAIGHRDGSEVVALLEEGNASEDRETGHALVELMFSVEESTLPGLAAGARLGCQLEVEGDRWSGSLSILAAHPGGSRAPADEAAGEARAEGYP